MMLPYQACCQVQVSHMLLGAAAQSCMALPVFTFTSVCCSLALPGLSPVPIQTGG